MPFAVVFPLTALRGHVKFERGNFQISRLNNYVKVYAVNYFRAFFNFIGYNVFNFANVNNFSEWLFRNNQLMIFRKTYNSFELVYKMFSAVINPNSALFNQDDVARCNLYSSIVYNVVII